MREYYNNVRELYNSKDVTYDPVLAKYMQDITLRFQSCEYISKGISSSPSLNPRYYVHSDMN